MVRNLNQLNKYRISKESLLELYGTIGDDKFGAFLVPYRKHELRIIASSDYGWDHVSVSLEHRIPFWEEMDFIKKLFFKPDEIAIQYHMTEKDHINIHPNCLHLWRPHMPKIILVPPKILV
jgi:hypothetical protein